MCCTLSVVERVGSCALLLLKGNEAFDIKDSKENVDTMSEAQNVSVIRSIHVADKVCRLNRLATHGAEEMKTYKCCSVNVFHHYRYNLSSKSQSLVGYAQKFSTDIEH